MIDYEINKTSVPDKFLTENKTEIACAFQAIYATVFRQWKKQREAEYEIFVEIAFQLAIEIEMAYEMIGDDDKEFFSDGVWAMEYVPQLAQNWVNKDFDINGEDLVGILLEEKRDDQNILVLSSHGEFKIDQNGYVLKYESNCKCEDCKNDPLEKISRFDLEEWRKRNPQSRDELDILEIGYWIRTETGGVYEPYCKDFVNSCQKCRILVSM